MKFLVILDMANNHRNGIVLPLCKVLADSGNEVLLIIEQKIAFHYIGDTEAQVWDNSERIQIMMEKYKNIKVILFNTFTGESLEKVMLSNQRRWESIKKIIYDFTPDKIVLWNGNYSYQNDTCEGLQNLGYGDKIIYMEVAWFSQREFVYFDEMGVNALSSLRDFETIALLPHQSIRLNLWKERYLTKRFGHCDGNVIPNSIFVPLQVDTDTNIQLNSPFKSMKEFIHFLEEWVPDHYSVVLKLHPKAKYTYPVLSKRSNFKIVASGNIDDWLEKAEMVVGINSTVLLEAIALNKKVLAFGESLIPPQAVAKVNADEMFIEAIKKLQVINKSDIDSFLYELVFNRQVAIEELEKQNVAHLFSRHPFNQWDIAEKFRFQQFHINAKEGKIMIQIGKSKVAKTAYIDVEKGGSVKVGDDCEIRHHAVLEVSGRYNGSIEIGDHCVIGIGNWLQGSGEIKIGNDVIIGPYCSIISTSHMYQDIETPIAKQPLETGKIVIEDDVWIGAHVTITHNVIIGAHSIIGANSFVNKDVPAYSIVAGTPAKVIRMRK